MNIPGAHLLIVSNQCTDFQKNPYTHFSEHAGKISCPQTDRQTDTQTDKQTDRQADRQTDRQTEGQGETNLPQNFVSGRYNNTFFKSCPNYYQNLLFLSL